MIKTVKPNQLKVGMYVHHLHRGWFKHPFLFNSFLVEDEKTLLKLQESGIEDLEIDTEKGGDVEGPLPWLKEAVEKRTEAVGKLAEPLPADSRLHHVIPLQREIQAARLVQVESRRIVRGLMADAKLGRPLNTTQMDQAVERITESILRSPDALVTLNRLKQKDDYTFKHSVGVCALLIAFCQASGMDEQTTREVGAGGLLHDVGKMLVPDEILLNPGRLTPEEYAVMQTHVERGKKILDMTPGIARPSVVVAFEHHERCNGSGYPAQTLEKALSRFGQMAAIADVFDAATSQRPYHRALEPTEALRQIYEMRDTFFNAELVQQFIGVIGVYPVGSLVQLESGLLAVVVQVNREDLLHPVVRSVFDTRKGHIIPLRDLDLSHPLPSGVKDRVIGYESPEKWGIDPLQVILSQ